MARLFHRRIVSGLATLALLALTAVASSAMTCADGRPCEMWLGIPHAAAPASPKHDATPCCAGADGAAGQGALCVSHYGGCAFAAGVYAAIPAAPTHPAATANLPSAWSSFRPAILPLPAATEFPPGPSQTGLSPPDNRGPPSC
jgi:hypothetical protein